VPDYPKDPIANLKFRQSVIQRAASDLVFRDYLLKKCESDPLFFINVFGYTHDPRRDPAKLPFITYEYQDALITALDAAVNDGYDYRIEKSRDMGVSWCVCLWMLWRWRFKPYQSFLMLSRKEDLVDGDSDSLFGHIDFAMRSMPAWLLPAFQRVKLSLVNQDNQSAIEGESTNSDAGRGGRRTAILWDEAAAFPNGGYEVASATRDNTLCRIMNSTPKGESNYFADSRKTTKTFSAHWSVHPRKNKGLYRVIKGQGIQILDGEAPLDYQYSNIVPGGAYGLRSPWYDNECKRTPNPTEIAQELDIDYLGSDYPFFDIRVLESLAEQYCRPPLYRGEISLYGKTGKFEERDSGPLRCWIDLQNGPPRHREFVVACDVSSGTGASNSIAVVADRNTGEKIAEWVSNITSVHEFARVAVALCYYFSFGERPAFLAWEGNGPGMPLAKFVINELKFHHIYYRKDELRSGKVAKDRIPGWMSTEDSKRTLLIEYREALGMGRFRNPSIESLMECREFKCQPDGRIEHQRLAMMRDGAKNHGDRVIADALASMLCMGAVVRNEGHAPRPVSSFPVGSIGWIMNQEKREAAQVFKARY
jgi:hypothetical protein